MKKIAIMMCTVLVLLSGAWRAVGQNAERGRRREERKDIALQRVAREERGGQRRESMARPNLFYETMVSAVWNNPGLLGKIEELDTEQKNKLTQVLTESGTRANDLRTQIQTAEEDLERLLNESTVENVLVTAAVEKLGELRTKLAKEQVRCYFALKQSLSPEQMKSLESLARGKRERP